MSDPVGLALPVLVELAGQAGFDLCGAAPAEPIPAHHLTDWLNAGLDADMDWMGARLHERLDVQRVLPGARTVVALACNYYVHDDQASLVARYGRGRDYHATMRDRLRRLRRALLERWPSLRAHPSVDYGPVMEKVWAARAGLGYVGKNGCFITDAFGSYVVLATLILDVVVEGGLVQVAPDRCGDCSLCLTACPTAALLGDARVDARRCLSYQTIENRDRVPEELRAALGGLVFGCDVCQDVCPLNRRPRRADPRFAPRPVAYLSARELAGLSVERHRELTAGTAIARAKYDGLRRNALYALGVQGDASARELVVRLCSDPSESVREAARWALGRLG